MIIDTTTLAPDVMYKMLIGSVLPRPIAWVSSISTEGIFNLAPFSFFTVASSNPPILCFSPALKSGTVDGAEMGVPKDTLRNARDTGEFVVNIVSHKLAEQMNETSGDYAADRSEFEIAGLTPADSCKVKAPRVAEALISYECVLHQILEFGSHPGAGNLVLGRIVCAHLDDSVYDGRHVDIEVLDPIGRLGGFWYSTTRDRFEIRRPKV